MEFIKEYKKYQIYKVDSIEIDSSGSEGSSRLIRNDIIIFLPDTIIELGNEIKSFESETKAIDYIDNNPYIQDRFNNAVERAEQENERQELRRLKEDERLKYKKRKKLNYEDEISNSKH